MRFPLSASMSSSAFIAPEMTHSSFFPSSWTFTQIGVTPKVYTRFTMMFSFAKFGTHVPLIMESRAMMETSLHGSESVGRNPAETNWTVGGESYIRSVILSSASCAPALVGAVLLPSGNHPSKQ
jgi:hypothetical protein